jgi:hypothetical protein
LSSQQPQSFQEAGSGKVVEVGTGVAVMVTVVVDINSPVGEIVDVMVVLAMDDVVVVVVVLIDTIEEMVVVVVKRSDVLDEFILVKTEVLDSSVLLDGILIGVANVEPLFDIRVLDDRLEERDSLEEVDKISVVELETIRLVEFELVELELLGIESGAADEREPEKLLDKDVMLAVVVSMLDEEVKVVVAVEEVSLIGVDSVDVDGGTNLSVVEVLASFELAV